MKIRMDKVIRTAVLIAVSVVTIIPILYTISASFKTNTEIILGGARLLPEEFTWENYGKAWSMARFDRYTWNSVRMSLVTTAGAVLFTSMSAYVFNRGRFPGGIFYTAAAVYHVCFRRRDHAVSDPAIDELHQAKQPVWRFSCADFYGRGGELVFDDRIPENHQYGN